MIKPSTKVRLLSNVPLNPSYEHVMDFTDSTAQYNYFNSFESHTYDDFSYQRDYVDAVRVPEGFDKLYDCNYMMFQNSAYTNKWFYAFITRKEYVNDSLTRIYFEIDVYQTWLFDFTFKPSFVEREHRPRWNSDGTPVINTVDEGLNYGTDYKTVSVQEYVPFTDPTQGNIYFLVVLTKYPVETGANNTLPNANVVGIPQPLNYYILPIAQNGGAVEITIDGAAQPSSDPLSFIENLITSAKTVNDIVNIYVTNHIGTASLDFPSSNFKAVDINGYGCVKATTLGTFDTSVMVFGNKYDHFDPVTESKLYMHPYCTYELTDFRGNTVEYKPQYLKDLTLTVRGSLGTDNKVVYSMNYNTDTLSDSDALRMNLQNALIDNNPNDIPILDDYYGAYMQGNRNQLLQEKNAIVYHGITQTIGAGMGMVGGALSGNAPAMVESGLEGLQAPVDTAMHIAQMNAKVKDISNIPPSLVKMGNNTAWDYGNGYTGVYLVKKQITSEYQKKLTDFFNMYGYKLNEVETPNLRSRQYWNYIKTVGAIITGNIPQEQLLKLKSIFDNGVTIWHTSDIGNYSLVNAEV